MVPPDVQYPDDPLSNPSAIRIEDILAGEEETSEPSNPAPLREGLPRTFRMRADKHYVEMLDTPPRSGGKESSATAAAPPAVREEEAVDAGALAAVQAGRDLAQSLAALLASTNLLSDRGPALASTVAANLIRAEAWKATCLLRVARFLRGELPPAPKPIRAQAIVDQLLKSIEPERRLRGVSIESRISVGDRSLSVDEDLFVAALSGLLMTTISLTEEPPGFTVAVLAEAKGSDVVFGISQAQAPAPANWTTAGPLTSAARIVSAFKGRVAASGGTAGTEVRVVVPRVA
ncbi:MAG: hypothetical protein ACRD3G_14360 [Vicinamibacterales bacterium]